MDNAAREILKYTAEEYYSEFGEEERLTELINGEVVDFSPPNIKHSRIVGRIYRIIGNYIDRGKCRCEAFISPTDVKLNEYNVVVPDVFVACDPDKFDKQKYNGAPDLVIEVVSTNRADDYIRKLFLYKENGVSEYWIVDPEKERTMVYFFENDSAPMIYSFDESVPVEIYGDRDEKLEINIGEIISEFED